MRPKKILLTGVHGQVGHALLARLQSYTVVALSRQELDLRDTAAIRTTVREIKPDLIINPAAYTAVDRAETEPELAFAINATAPRILAEEAAQLGAGFIHFSTDYVFDGSQNRPYLETDSAHPQSVYGETKLAGEQAVSALGLPHLILRTSWVYGAYGRNFLKSIIRAAKTQAPLRVVQDQTGGPTSCICIADAVLALIEKWQMSDEESGIYHFTNAGSTSWYAFACAVLTAYAQLKEVEPLLLQAQDILPITTAQYPTLASRPANSRLDNRKLWQTFGLALPDWQSGLQQEILHFK